MPAVIVIVVGLIRRRVLASTLPAPVHSALEALTVVAAFSAGYFALSLGPVVPRIDRDWIFLSAVAALPATFVLASIRSLYGQIAFVALVSAGAAALMFVLVPDWETLDDRRLFIQLTWGIAMLAASLTGLIINPASDVAHRDDDSEAAAEPSRTSSLLTNGTLVWLPIVATAAPLSALAGSLMFAMIATCLLGSLIGLAIDTLWSGGKRNPSETSVGVISAFVVTSLMLTAYVNTFSQIPQAVFWLLPLGAIAPAIILRTGGHNPSWRRTLIGGVICCLICGSLLGWAVAAEWEALNEPDLY
ncbi:MAG TPA: hypothetical protein DDW52_26840 [Planctomycetaceae bacterium]|nr:hypothetical protein [Planctomycetaceae bacterium]